MIKWIEDSKRVLTFEDLKAFSYGLARSQGSYGRIYENLLTMDDDEIENLNDYFINHGYKNELMTIISIFEG